MLGELAGDMLGDVLEAGAPQATTRAAARTMVGR
jgi:hypothetical protein